MEIILQGYSYWSRYGVGVGGHVDVEDLVEYFAYKTRANIDAHQGIWSDSASIQYFLTTAPHTDSVNSYKNEDYDGHGMTLTSFATPIELDAAGAAIAFIVDAGLGVADVPADPYTQCPTGKYFVHASGCVSGSASPVLLPSSNGATTAGRVAANPSVCADAGAPCVVNADCCNLVCTSSGTCYVAPIIN